MSNDADGKLGRLAAVFELLRGAESWTVTELASQTGLSRPTVSALLASLEARGLAAAGEPETTGAGRPASQWSLPTSVGHVVAADVLRNSVLITLARFDGTVERTLLRAIPWESGTDRVRALVGALQDVVRGAASELGPLLAVTVSTTGTVDGDGTIVQSTSVPEWGGFPLAAHLSEVFAVPVRVENDINAAAYGEFVSRWVKGTLGSRDDLVYAHVATGIVTGLVLSGNIHRGTAFNAGEFGLRVTEETGEDGDAVLSQIWQSLSAVAAVLDPSAIVVSSALPGPVVPRLRRYLAERLESSAPSHRFEAALLGQISASVGALSLALGDAQEVLIGHDSSTPHYPKSIDPIMTALATGTHTSDEVSTPTPSALRVGVVGVGARSTILTHAELPHNNARIVAACDPAPTTEDRLREWVGLDPAHIEMTTDLERFIELDLDAAIVTSPDDTHAEITCRLLEAGIPVYLEKPIAIDLEGATRILETAYATGTRLYVGHNMRHMSVVRTMRDIVRRGEIGEVKAIWCRHFVGHGGDFYFKDWHAEREHGNGLLLQKAAHDIDVMNWLTDSHATRVVGMGGLTLYGDITDRQDRSGHLMHEWYSHDNWPPLSQRGLNPVVDVEDLSMFSATMASGAFISYQQCHYTPDYWRNYTVIGTEGRIENFGDGEGGHIALWNRRSNYNPKGDVQYPILGDANGHDDADILTMTEFLEFVRSGAPTDTSPLGAWYAVATAIQATASIRDGAMPQDVPALRPELIDYFTNNQER